MSYPRRPTAAPLLTAALCLFASCSDSGTGGQDCDRCDAAADASSTADADPSAPDATPAAFCDSFGSFPSEWISGGPDCGIEPDIQVHQLNDDTYILRQSLCTSLEAPFLYLLFGEDKALLEDTGDGGIDIVGTVNALVEEREAAVGHDIELIVANSHAHGDHHGGNQAFANDGATMVGAFQASITAFFGMSWPHDPVAFDLGNRIVDVFGIPGHQDDHIAIYDRNDGLLLTGDTFYPGRLFIRDFSAYKASIDFLVSFTESREVCAILGTHIEMSTTPGDDYDFVNHHPNEHELQLSSLSSRSTSLAPCQF
jgi:glyoxylase-like metal-dependent hydrolase (beta-lactamase superfamily II)